MRHRDALIELYHLSAVEDVHHPPADKNRGRRDEFHVPEGSLRVRGPVGKWCLWITEHCGENGAWRSHPIQSGSNRIVAALTTVRCTTADMLAARRTEHSEAHDVHKLVTFCWTT